jgi:RNA polymerase sigma factor for flagellar operon FliA
MPTFSTKGGSCSLMLNAASGDDSDAELDAVDPHGSPLDQLSHEQFMGAVAEAIRALPEREQLVLSLYHEEELNLREIGAVLNVSESRVCQIHGQALLRLRGRLADWGASQ